MSKEGKGGARMEARTKRLLKILTGVIAALLFGVFVLSFFTFSENNYTSEYGKFRSIIAANASVPQKSSSGFYVFSRKSEESELSDDAESAVDDSESESETSSSSEAESSSSSSGAASSSSVSSEKSSSSSAESPSSSDNFSSSEAEGDVIPILGSAVLTKTQLLKFSAPNISKMRLTCSVEELIDLYLSIGAKYGVRGDVAYLQAIIETGWFKYNRPNGYHVYENGSWVYKDGPRPDGYYVVPEDNNFCGLGVTGYISENNTICRFATAALGVEAQIQHLYAYACKSALPSGTTKIDPRFNLVDRGCAPNWNDLGSGKWAADTGYAKKILGLYSDAQKY